MVDALVDVCAVLGDFFRIFRNPVAPACRHPGRWCPPSVGTPKSVWYRGRLACGAFGLEPHAYLSTNLEPFSASLRPTDGRPPGVRPCLTPDSVTNRPTQPSTIVGEPVDPVNPVEPVNLGCFEHQASGVDVQPRMRAIAVRTCVSPTPETTSRPAGPSST